MARLPVQRQPLAEAAGSLIMQPAVVPRMEIANLTRLDRINRRPEEKFFTVQRPWDVQPFMLHPVLPGETLTAMQMQSRVLTDPLKNQLSGGWMEYYFFYVKHTDLLPAGGGGELGDSDEDNDVLTAMKAMHLANTAPTGLIGVTQRNAYYKANATSRIDWIYQCTQAVIRWYFRDAAESINGYGNYGVRAPTNMGNIYKARVGELGWMESIKIEDVNPTGQGDLPGVEGFQDVFVPAAWSTHYDQWEYMRQIKLITPDVTFEDYMASFGVKVPERESKIERRPELIRYIREWQYPSNTVDGATGAVASAMSWAVNARADKPRRFSEPGFILGVSVFRPKVFFGNQIAHATSMLDDAYAWLPAILRENPFTSLVEYDHNEGPIDGVFNTADDYWVDRRDLFVRGGQFLNFVPTDAITTCPIVDLPKIASADNDINMWYASDQDAQNLFIDDDNSDGKTYVRQDGVVRLQIKSHQHVAKDHT